MEIDFKEYDAKTEFKKIIVDYVFPLLGLKENNLQYFSLTKNLTFQIEANIFFQDDKIYFFPYNNAKFGYYIETANCYNGFDLTLSNKVVKKLVSVSYNNFQSKTKKQNSYMSLHQCISNYKVAVQDAICEHLTGKSNNKEKDYLCNQTLLTLFNKLEDWSLKTYEGKKVPFGFIMDLSCESKTKLNYLTFLEDEFSATITDGISSVIIIDENGNYIDYKSIVSDNRIISCEMTNCLPIRFAQIIEQNIKENSKRIGVFLLTGGDIFIAKNGKIELIKRNGKWSTFSYESFLNAMKRYNNTNKIDDKILKEVFSTAIDVSLAHCGGIIALVENGNKLNVKNSEESILSESDNLLVNKTDEELRRILRNSDEKQYNIEKRLYKRKIIQNLLNEKKNFTDLDRKMRSELVGLDGATIIQKDGKIVSFGAIIQNEKGSSGGGRGAAAKLLSDYGGLSIKISTDGYIEVYVDKELKYFIK